jgi:hypothetical protein
MVLTALAIIYVPFGAVTSCYGVNALEFVDGAYTHIRTVWEVAASVTVASLGVPLFGLLALSSVVYATQQGILMTILDWPGITRFCFGLLVFCMVIIHAVLGGKSQHGHQTLKCSCESSSESGLDWSLLSSMRS